MEGGHSPHRTPPAQKSDDYFGGKEKDKEKDKSRDTSNESGPELQLNPVAPESTNTNFDVEIDKLNEEFTTSGCKFFHGTIPNKDVFELLRKDGDYLVKTTDAGKEKEQDKKDSDYLILDVRSGDKIYSWPILVFKQDDGVVTTLSKKTPPSPLRSSIMELIELHKTTPLEDGTVLKNPIQRVMINEINRSYVSKDKKLGAGAYGEVYSGKLQSKAGPIPVAIKVTKLDSSNKAIIDNLREEAMLMQRLTHTNVVSFFGISSEAGDLWILMELVTGGSLDHFVKDHHLNAYQHWVMCYDVARGLDYLHRSRILHRDMAARNCLVSVATPEQMKNNQQQYCVKISDFGMSQKGENHRIDAKERTAIKWVAPEIFTTAVYQKACDVWAYGMVVYEIYAKRPPFHDKDNKEVRANIHLPTFRPTLTPHMPEYAKKLMKACWQQNPSKRPAMPTLLKHIYDDFNLVSRRSKHNSNQLPRCKSESTNTNTARSSKQSNAEQSKKSRLSKKTMRKQVEQSKKSPVPSAPRTSKKTTRSKVKQLRKKPS